MTTELKQTPFAAAYPPGVTEWVDVFGYAVPVTWGDPDAEYRAVRNHAAAMEFSMLLKWDVRGRGAVETVNRVFSRDVGAMQRGSILYGVVVDEAGKMVDDCTVFMHGAEHIRVFGGNTQVGDYLDRRSAKGVTIVQRRAELAQLSVQGPLSREILQALTSADLGNDALRYYRFLTGVQMAGMEVQVNRIGFTGELGYEILLPVDHATAIWNALFAVGTPKGLRAAGAAVVMMCRIESGMIMGGLEYDDSMTPYESRMGWAVDLTKDEFQGRSALTKARESAQVTIVSVMISGQGQFDGARLRLNGSDIGQITMAIPSPYLGGRFLGLARVRKDLAAIGSSFEVSAGNKPTATIVRTPVYDPERIRVRS